MKLIRTITAITLAVIALSSTAFAFGDMPDGELGEALQSAVDNKIIQGYEDGTIKPYEPITRAQMAAIITRVFGTDRNSELTFNDVADDVWYRDAVEKSVYMGAFKGDTDGNFNPDSNITFQETYTVLSRVFQFTSRTTTAGVDLMVPSEDCLDHFPDKESISDWAVQSVKEIVGNGGYTGIDGMLKPAETVSRGEFALIMKQLVSLYIDEPGLYSSGFGDASVVIRCGDVHIENINTDKNIIFGYGTDSASSIKNSVCKGCIVVYGGEDKTPVENKGRMMADESLIGISADFYDCRIFSPASLVSVAPTNADLKTAFIKSYSETGAINYVSLQ